MSIGEGNPAGGALVPIEAEIAELEDEISNHSSRYWRGPQAPAKQSRYRDLLLARQNGTPAPKPDAKSQELLSIETLMAQPGSKYWRGPLAEAMQQRYRQLVGGEAPTTSDAWRATPDAAQSMLPAAVVAEWNESDQFNAHLHRAQDKAALVLGALDREAAATFQGVFAGLADGVQGAVLSVIAAPEPGYVKPADDNEMALFESAIPGASAIIAKWGREARRRVGMVLDKGQRIDARLSDAEKAQLRHVWEHSPPRERQLMAWALGS